MSPFFLSLIGVDSREVPPVPIPNTEVKLSYAYDTWSVTTWENWKMPILCGTRFRTYSSIAQSVEHAAVNRRVVGSSPTWGAILRKSESVLIRTFLFFLLYPIKECAIIKRVTNTLF